MKKGIGAGCQNAARKILAAFLLADGANASPTLQQVWRHDLFYYIENGAQKSAVFRNEGDGLESFAY